MNGKCVRRFSVLAGVAFLLAACGGGSNGGGGTSDSSGENHSVAASVRSGAPAEACPDGGISVDTGIDTNGNGVLDASEVTKTQYVCNGSSGFTTLVAISDEPAGLHCAAGGKKVETGEDANGSGVLDAGEVGSTFYICNGAPGAGIVWQEVSGASVQAVSNTGYMAHNDTTRVAVTLPAAPVYGDIIQVTGVGSGGWMIAQNDGQSIVTGSGRFRGRVGEEWTPSESPRDWSSVACSADGTKRVAVVWGGQIYTSADSGATWTQRYSIRDWSSVASSADGTKLVAAAVNGGQLYTSVDSGESWTPRDSPRAWIAVASSTDGGKLVAAVSGGQLYTSVDSGQNWTPRESARSWASVASSADGARLVAVVYGGQIYVSDDAGVTWVPRESARSWASVASSAGGTRLVAAVGGGQIYTSIDSGETWTPRESAREWRSVASSADGIRLVAAAYGGELYTSSDAGVNWTVRTGADNWTAVASSAGGTDLVAAVSGGLLYGSSPQLVASTTTGTAGFLSGERYDAADLQYIGNGTFVVRGYADYLVAQ